MAAEARIARRLGWPVAIGGGTAAGAQRAAAALVAQGIDALVSFGLAGGLDPALRPGSLLVASAVVLDGRHYLADAALSLRLGGMTSHAVLGAMSIAASPALKQRLHAETGAAAVDLESGAVAREASASGLPFAVLRAVCDPAGFALPPAALAALDAGGAIGIGRVLASLAASPGQLPALFRLAGDAAAARAALLGRVRRLAGARGRSAKPR